MKMDFIIVVVTFLAVGFFFLQGYLETRRQEKRFIDNLRKNYGKPSEKKYSAERYERIRSLFEKHREDGQIDDITWNDLNMDDIFRMMDTTFSASGEEYLYYTLRNTKCSKKKLEQLENVVGYFMNHEETRIKVQCFMKKLGHTGKYSLYDYLEYIDVLGERSNRKHIMGNLLFLPLFILVGIQPLWGLLGIFGLMCYNIMTYFKEKNEIEPYIVSFAYIIRLVKECEKLYKMNIPVCETEWTSMKKNLQALKGIKKGAHWIFSVDRNMGSGNPLSLIDEYMKMIFHVDLMQFNKMLSLLKGHIEDIDSLIQIIGYLESAIVIGSFRTSQESYCIPQWEGEVLHIKDTYHPLISNPVKTSVTAEKGVLITGSNASGKSTFLKTIALNVIFAQTINTVLAEEYQAPFYEIMSSMSLHDDIKKGESYYIVEIKALKRILDVKTENRGKIICFVDEVLRGTNTVERIAASTQILKSLAGGDVLCFAATHDIELTQLLKDDYDNYHFEELVKDEQIVFPYILNKGPAQTRNAIKLLEMMGYNEQVVQKAQVMAEQFVETGIWHTCS